MRNTIFKTNNQAKAKCKLKETTHITRPDQLGFFFMRNCVASLNKGQKTQMPATLKAHTDSFVFASVCVRGQIPVFR